MKKNLLLFCFVLALQPVIAQDYNKLDKEYQDIATQALGKLSPATKQWFETTIQKHPSGNFDSSWAKGQLNSKFTGTQMNEMAEMFVVMMAYLKMVQKEAREDRKIQRNDAALEVKLQESKLDQQNKAIETGKTESKERYDNAMNAANKDLTIGVVSTSNQNIAATKTNPSVTNPAIVNSKMTNTAMKIDSSKSLISNKERQITKEQQTSEESKDQKDQSRDRRKASLDNLQKMLGILRSMNTQL